MHPFKFSLQTLLDVKETGKKEIMRRFGEEQRNLQLLRRRLQELFESRSAIYFNMDSCAREGMRGYEMSSYHHYAACLTNQMRQQQVLIKKTEERIRMIEMELITMEKDIKVLEKLKEKQYREYNALLIKENEKQTDELVAFKSAAGGDFFG